MLSLLPDLKTLTDDQMLHFKVEVLLIIDNIKRKSGPSTIPTPYSSTGSNNYPHSSRVSAVASETSTNQIGMTSPLYIKGF